MPQKGDEKQQEIYEYIKAQTSERGYPPTVREICDAVGLKSTASVSKYLARLEENGLIRRSPTSPRAIEVIDSVDASYRAEPIPVIGRVAAGKPILADQYIDDYFLAPQKYVNSSTYFLRVKGDSMINAGICNGDLILVDSDSSVDNGDIAVILLGDEATVKRFFVEADGYYRLQPENDSMEPVYVKNVHILGRVIAAMKVFP
ncbi:transcriptional repressor LexA [Ruminococcus sp. CLA-AA-H200]|uniref:LexA repressor n=1 Tax=Ruminococcus turbiniformis TaxID=2881258 RepID=A0ABS8FXC7_9FIRM|nr:transcriptional repressor LexA [Ruminococcus turbiniformis]MCC2254612.1 transcriptional repressor LexA [Ruminococcus turbiniformis]